MWGEKEQVCEFVYYCVCPIIVCVDIILASFLWRDGRKEGGRGGGEREREREREGEGGRERERERERERGREYLREHRSHTMVIADTATLGRQQRA